MKLLFWYVVYSAFLYFFGVLVHAFIEWQTPLWLVSEWDNNGRGVYVIFWLLFCMFPAAMHVDGGS